MRPRIVSKIVFFVTLLLVLSACGAPQPVSPTVDTAMIYTQAAQTVAAQFTQTSAALTAAAPTQTNTPAATATIPSTFTPIFTPPVFTPQPVINLSTATATLSILPVLGTPTGALCNNSAFVRDIGIPDGTVLKPGQHFDKGWLIQNTGTCNWVAGYTLVQTGGNTNFSAATFIIHYPKDFVMAGAVAEISLSMTAPKQPGTYEAWYQMYSNLNVPFGTGMSVRIEVRK